MRFPAALAIPLLASLLLGGCKPADPKADLEVTSLETYWVIDRSIGGTNYLAPVARFHVRNKTDKPSRSVQATLTFHRKGEEAQTWGSDWKQVAAASEPLAPGQTVMVVMKSDARYSSTGLPETFFGHALFKDVNVELFLRAGSSPWVKFAQVDVDRRIGTRELQATQGGGANRASPVPSASPAGATASGSPVPPASAPSAAASVAPSVAPSAVPSAR